MLSEIVGSSIVATIVTLIAAFFSVPVLWGVWLTIFLVCLGLIWCTDGDLNIFD